MPPTGPTAVRHKLPSFLSVLLIFVFSVSVWRASAQQREVERELLARGGRVLADVGPGLRAIKRDAAGHYYVLGSPANSIVVFGADGKRAGQVPNANSKGAKIVYAADFDLDSDGRIFVADQGGNAIKIFGPDGSLSASVHTNAPTSIACLSGGDFAVTALRSERLVLILNENGSTVRGFGDVADALPKANPAALVERGRIFGDSAEHVYFAFAALNDPTFRIYDRYGFASAEISIPAGQFISARDRRRVDVFGIPRRANIAQNPVFSAIAADAGNQNIWAAVGNSLVQFDKDGTRVATYRTYTAEGAAVEPVAILVEQNQILLGADPLGVFEFAKPGSAGAKAGPGK